MRSGAVGEARVTAVPDSLGRGARRMSPLTGRGADRGAAGGSGASSEGRGAGASGGGGPAVGSDDGVGSGASGTARPSGSRPAPPSGAAEGARGASAGGGGVIPCARASPDICSSWSREKPRWVPSNDGAVSSSRGPSGGMPGSVDDRGPSCRGGIRSPGLDGRVGRISGRASDRSVVTAGVKVEVGRRGPDGTGVSTRRGRVSTARAGVPRSVVSP